MFKVSFDRSYSVVKNVSEILYVKAEHVTQFTIRLRKFTALCVSMYIHSMVWYGHKKIYVMYVYISTQHGKVTDTYSEK